jgi:D-glycerate 3-kinase
MLKEMMNPGLTMTLQTLTQDDMGAIADKVRRSFMASAREMQVHKDLEPVLVDIYIPLAAYLAHQATACASPPIIGVNGAQGAGKSTLCRLLQIVLEEGFDKHVATFSIDDIYLTRTERKALAQKVHPLLETRGVPGTHDVALGLQLIRDLKTLAAGQSLRLPVFDKAMDDRAPEQAFRQVTGPIDLILFEGWCVGAVAQSEAELRVAINSLEQREDPDQAWRHYVNQQLRGDYKTLFQTIDFLIMLKVPGMASVLEWRGKQERKLAAMKPAQGGRAIMDTAALRRFIMHYERLTQATLAEMPNRADLVLVLNLDHQIDSVQSNPRRHTMETRHA